MVRVGMDSALSSIIGRNGGVERCVKDLLLLHHRRLGHHLFSVLSRLYAPLFEKANRSSFIFWCVMCVSW
jgi:hypothetical protein